MDQFELYHTVSLLSMDGGTDGQRNGRTDRGRDGWTEGWTDGRTTDTELKNRSRGKLPPQQN